MIDFFILWSSIIFSCIFLLDKKSKIISVLFFFVILLFFIGLRPIALGTDTSAYYDIYLTWHPSFLESGLELGFTWITSISKLIDLDAEIWLLLLTFIYLSLIFIAIYKIYENDVVIFLLIFSNLFFWLFAINIIRYGLAFSIFIFAISVYSVNKKRRSISLFFYLVSSIGFHVSILIQILFFLLYSRRVVDFLFKYYLVFIFSSLYLLSISFDLISVLEFLVKTFQNYLPERFSSRFFFYLNDFSGGKEINLGFSFVISLSLVILSASFREFIYLNVTERRRIIFELSFYFSFLNITFLPLLYKYDTFSRILSGFDFFSIFLMYELLSVLLRGHIQKVFSVFILSSLFFYKVVHVGFVNGYLSDRF